MAQEDEKTIFQDFHNGTNPHMVINLFIPFLQEIFLGR
jgi:hypothetical protein